MWRIWSWLARRSRPASAPSLSISVTETDIALAAKAGSPRNPVALALMRQLDVANVHVSADAVTLIRGWTPLDVDVVPLPQSVRFFLSDFEEGRRVRPMSFSLPTGVGARLPALASRRSTLELPADERAIVRRIQGKAEVLLGRTADFPFASRDVYVVRQTLDSYLPDTVNAYLTLPTGWTEQAITADGRTGRQVLHHALGLIEARLDAIAAEVGLRRADELLAQDRFLEDRFGDPQR